MKVTELSSEVGAPSDQRAAAILAELEQRGAESYPHGRGSLLGHLRGTLDVLTAWRQPDRVRLAGAVHSGYSSEAWPHVLFDLTERDTVRALVGDEAERLAYLFCALNREDLFAYLRGLNGMVEQPVRLQARKQRIEYELTRRDVGDLLVLYLANAAEQACMADGGPTCWLTSAAKLGQWAKQNADAVPPILEGCTARFSKEFEKSVLATYDTALRMLSMNIDHATAGLTAASRDMPHIAEPLVWLGYLSLARGDADARTLGARAAALLEMWGTPWDKRLSLQQWRILINSLQALADGREADNIAMRDTTLAALTAVTNSPEDFYLVMDDALLLSHPQKPRCRAAPTKPSDRLGSLPPRFRHYLERVRRQGAGILYPGLTAQPWHDPRQFPIAMALEKAVDDIAGELSALSTEQFMDEAEQIVRVNRWSVVFLQKRGVRCDDICGMCPSTASVLDFHQDETLMAGVAYFSCLDPGTSVALHRGPSNARLRCHLGIEVPDGCGIKVGGIAGRWERGRCIVFDDSFMHEVWNGSSTRRVVLIVDIWHPDLSREEIALLQWMST